MTKLFQQPHQTNVQSVQSKRLKSKFPRLETLCTRYGVVMGTITLSSSRRRGTLSVVHFSTAWDLFVPDFPRFLQLFRRLHLSMAREHREQE